MTSVLGTCRKLGSSIRRSWCQGCSERGRGVSMSLASRVGGVNAPEGARLLGARCAYNQALSRESRLGKGSMDTGGTLYLVVTECSPSTLSYLVACEAASQLARRLVKGTVAMSPMLPTNVRTISSAMNPRFTVCRKGSE